MNPNEIQTLQTERFQINVRLESGCYPAFNNGLTSIEQRSKDVKRLKEINKILNDWYLKK